MNMHQDAYRVGDMVAFRNKGRTYKGLIISDRGQTHSEKRFVLRSSDFGVVTREEDELSRYMVELCQAYEKDGALFWASEAFIKKHLYVMRASIRKPELDFEKDILV